MRRLGYIVLALFVPVGGVHAAPATEPDYETIRSGKCVVNVCTDFDFGDHVFRMYSAGWASTLKEIPVGACTCKSSRFERKRFNGYLGFGVRTPGGRFIPGISLSRIWPPGHPRARPKPKGESVNPVPRPGENTFEQYLRLKPRLEQVHGFTRSGDDFDRYDVFQTRFVFGGGGRRYFFIPKEPVELKFGSTVQRITFETPLARSPDEAKRGLPSFKVAVTLHYSGAFYFFQFFNPRLVKSDHWISEIEKTRAFLATRLRPAPARGSK